MDHLFETDRLYVRELQLNDLDDFNDLQCNSEVMRFITGKAMVPSESAAALERYIQQYSIQENVFRVWAVVRKSDHAFLGTCALVTMEGATENDLGYRFRQKYWGHGYATEIAHGLIRYAFTELNLPFLLADADRENMASVKILDRTMKFIRESYYPDEDCTARQYRLDRKDYITQKP